MFQTRWCCRPLTCPAHQPVWLSATPPGGAPEVFTGRFCESADWAKGPPATAGNTPPPTRPSASRHRRQFTQARAGCTPSPCPIFDQVLRLGQWLMWKGSQSPPHQSPPPPPHSTGPGCSSSWQRGNKTHFLRGHCPTTCAPVLLASQYGCWLHPQPLSCTRRGHLYANPAEHRGREGWGGGPGGRAASGKTLETLR